MIGKGNRIIERKNGIENFIKKRKVRLGKGWKNFRNRMDVKERIVEIIEERLKSEELIKNIKVMRDREGVEGILMDEKVIEIVEEDKGNGRKENGEWIVGGKEKNVISIRKIILRNLVEKIKSMKLKMKERILGLIVGLRKKKRKVGIEKKGWEEKIVEIGKENLSKGYNIMIDKVDKNLKKVKLLRLKGKIIKIEEKMRRVEKKGEYWLLREEREEDKEKRRKKKGWRMDIKKIEGKSINKEIDDEEERKKIGDGIGEGDRKRGKGRGWGIGKLVKLDIGKLKNNKEGKIEKRRWGRIGRKGERKRRNEKRGKEEDKEEKRSKKSEKERMKERRNLKIGGCGRGEYKRKGKDREDIRKKGEEKIVRIESIDKEEEIGEEDKCEGGIEKIKKKE